ncbi:NADAR domain-containing protein [Kutzneria kofuensis]|uniref:RibA/ribD-fused uncharacterized protein n=1 Tax=Kutzneria kofuensis TaxID=103725 RepID=A0A7W9NF92_9PSEU|nr:NADAR domain-containing protein [Kutzneria kofuensis]MBB5891157.1 ribA/ribD-fused uncharacterized protein [Kutzneria kofuensis]
MLSVEDLVRAEAAGQRLKYVYFWGHEPRRDGRIGASCLSQWWPAEFTVDGLTFPTAEHYMMHRKALLFGDEDTAARILRARHPNEAKTLGREVRGYDNEVWDANRFDVVVAGNLAKFGQHALLCRYLLGTSDRVLVEASPLDRIWGIGLTADDDRAASPSTWLGANLLGFVLMAVREQLVGESLIGGREKRDITIVEYDPAWPARFRSERARIRKALRDNALRIDHVGSTAVPGLAAKPVVDIQVSVADVEREDAYLPQLEAAGYHLRVRQPDHRMVRTEQLDVHVHICPAGGRWERDHLLFGDWLRATPADRAAYEKLKRELATRKWFDMNQYAEAKGDLIDEILGRAKEWADRTGWTVAHPR